MLVAEPQRSAALRAWRPPVVVALAGTVAAECLLVVVPHLSGAEGLWIALVALAGWVCLVSDARLESRPRTTAAAIALTLVVALLVPPRDSNDLWSYVMYGRTVAFHHASPYVHAPSAYPHDPFVRLVASGWRGTKSVYGPLFTGVSAVLARLAGASVLRARLAFQGLALLSVVAVLAVLWLETRSVRVLAFVGLHPAVVIAIVNGGHNDAIVGFAVLSGAVLVARRRVTAAGVAVGLGVLVKASTAFGILGIGIWLLARDRRAAARFLSAAALTSVVGYLPAGTAASAHHRRFRESHQPRIGMEPDLERVRSSGERAGTGGRRAARTRGRVPVSRADAAVPRGVGRDRGVPLRGCLRAAVVFGVGVAFGRARVAVVVGDARRRARRHPGRGLRALPACRVPHADGHGPRSLHRDRGVRRARGVRVRHRVPAARRDAIEAADSVTSVSLIWRHQMPKYLVTASYTSEGIRGVMKTGGTARSAAVQKAVEGLGGKLESFHFAFGKDDAFVILDMPDDIAAAAAPRWQSPRPG